MRKALLVDDEKLVRKGLRAIIERSDASFKTIYECSNGKEALEIISSEKIDLVITDIRMPSIDGITFMKKARRMKHCPQFIILSGYDDFHYAREAIDCGARAYLLKPAQREELLEAVNKIDCELQMLEISNCINDRMHTLAENYRKHGLNFILHNEDVTMEEIEAVTGAIDNSIFKHAYSIAVLIEHRDRRTPGDCMHNSKLKDLVDCFLKSVSCGAITFFDLDGSIILISGETPVFNELLSYMKAKAGSSFMIGLSDPAEGPGSIRKAYLQAKEAARHRVLRPSSEIIRYSEIANLEKGRSIPVNLIKKATQMLATERVDEMAGLIKQLMDESIVQTCHYSYFEKMVDYIYHGLVQNLMENFPHYVKTFETTYGSLKDLKNFSSMDEYMSAFRECILDTGNRLKSMKDAIKERRIVDQAIEYINNNYNRNISMTMVSNHVSVNYNYFSYLFNKYINMRFPEYIKKVRIENAKKYLDNSNYKVYEISRMIGYKNPKHFTKSFREITGIAPNEYRDYKT